MHALPCAPSSHWEDLTVAPVTQPQCAVSRARKPRVHTRRRRRLSRSAMRWPAPRSNRRPPDRQLASTLAADQLEAVIAPTMGEAIESATTPAP